MRKSYIHFILLSLFLILMSGSASSQQNVTQLGRWGKGECDAIFRRGELTFIGNGSYLEVYQTQQGELQKIDALLLPGLIEDIWVRSDIAYIYVTCGSHGFIVVQFDTQSNLFNPTYAQYNTADYAYGVMQFGFFLYLADGESGLSIYYLINPFIPQLVGNASIPGITRDVWVLNDTTALVAADMAGIYTIRAGGNHANPILIDSLDFETAFPLNEDVPDPIAYRIITNNDSVAYVASGEGGGIRIIDIRNPGALSELSTYVESNPLNMLDLWIDGNYAYVVAGDQGLYTKIDVTNPENPSLASYDLNTEGFSNNIVVDADTAYVCDGYNGMLLVDASDYPVVVDSIEASDVTYDVDVFEDYAYLATGESGLKVLDINTMSDYIEEIGSLNTPGEAYGIKKPGGSRVYVADGSRGLSVLSVFNPAYPSLVKTDVFSINDVCTDVDVNETYAFLACGKDGLRIVDITETIFEVNPLGPLNTPGSLKALKLINDRLYLADSSGVYIYDISGLPTQVSIVDSLTNQENDVHAVGIDVYDNTVVVANGEYGILLWNLLTDKIKQYANGEFNSDVVLKEKTIYATDSGYGLRIFDFSLPDTLLGVGNFPTGGNSQRITISDLGDRIYLADGSDGFYILQSTIQPEINTDVLTLNFGRVPPQSSRPMILWVINTGTALLNIDSVKITNSPAFSFNETNFSVIPGDTHSVTIYFNPSSSQPVQHSATAAIYSNDFNQSPLYISLQGEVGTWIDINQPYQTDILTLGLWHMDEQAGATVYDFSAYNQDALIVGQATRTDTSKFGRSIRFHGNDNSRVEIPYNSIYNLWDHPFTVELWFYMLQQSTNWNVLLKRGLEAGNLQYELLLSPIQSINCYVRDRNGKVYELTTGPSTQLNIDQWYHVALTWDKDTLRLYLNSVIQEDQSALRGGLFYEDSEPISIGSNRAGGSPFSGYVDEVRISNVARQPWEFPVHKSRLVAEEDTLRFGQVFVNHSRRVPLHLINTGTQPLIINDIHSAGSPNISITPALDFVLYQEQDTTVWITYTPVSEAVLDGAVSLIIESTDPTYPIYSIPLSGEGVYSLPAGGYDPDPFTLGLWHFDEVGGNTVNDETAYDRHGTFYGDASLDEVIYQFSTGRSLHFEGDDGICVVPVDERMKHWGGFTVEGWFRVDGELLQSQGVIIKRGDGSSDQFDLFVEGNSLKGRLFNQEGTAFTVTTGEEIQYAQWYHAAVTYMANMDYQEGVFRLYLNGNEIDTVNFEGQMAGFETSEQIDTLSVLIGNAWDLESPFRGNIEEIRISGINRQSWEFNVEMARIQVSQTTLDFGKVYTEGERKLKLSITNPGMDTLWVDSLYTSASNIFHVGSSRFSVAPYNSQVVLVEVRFTPDNTGEVTDTLKIINNDPFWKETPYAVILKGEGVSEKVTGPYVPDNYTRGLYHFDEDTGTIVIDVSAAGMDGALIGGVSRSATARFGRSLRFDGTDGRITISNEDLLNITESEFTVELWFSTLKSVVDRRVLISRGFESEKQFELALDPTNGMELSVWDIDGEKDLLFTGNPNLFNTNQWYHTAFVWSEDSLRLYLNNHQMGSLYFPSGFRQIDSQLLTIGIDPTADPIYAFEGYIDEIRFSTIARADWEFNVLSPSIVVYPTELNFATVWINHSRVLRFTIKNNGDQDLEIENIAGATGVYSISDSLRSFILPRLKTRDVEVSFTPSDADVQHDQLLTITSNDQGHPTIYVTLRGIGTESKLVPGQYIVDAHTTALYQFNNVSGDTMIYDASNGGHHALLRNGVRWTSNGLFGGALSFDGINDYAEIGSHPDFSFDPNTESHTIECFFRTDTISHMLISKGYTDRIDSLEYFIKLNGEGRFDLSGRNISGSRLNTDSWHHFALAYNHITQFYVLYLDGDTLSTWDWNESESITTQRPLLLGAAELDSALLGHYFEGYIDEVRVSDIAREPWEFGLVDYGIKVVNINPDPPVYGQPLTLQLQVPADLEADIVNFYYGSGGSRAYQKTTASVLIEDTMQVALPSSAITLKGFEYYVEVFSGEDTLTHPILDPRNNPISSVVRHNGIESSMTFLYRQFQMFSVPFNLDSTDVKNVLEDDLGKFDPYQWRLFWWMPQDSFYIDYREQTKDYFDFTAGRSYWIITDFERKVDVEAGTTVSTDSSFRLILNPGWNMISDPYNFAVRWDDCSVSSDSIGTLYYYDPINGYQLYWNELSPWKGYWVYNADENTAFLSILPRQSGLSKPSTSSKSICKQIQSEEWAIRFSTWAEGAKDLDNYAGVKQSAGIFWDMYDQPEPPPVGNYVSFFFDHSDWSSRSGRYAVDIRKQNDEGCVWDCCIETKISDQDIHVSWEMFNELPKDWEAYFIDLDEGYSKNLLSDSGIQFRTSEKVPNVHQAKMIVGTRAFIEKHSEGIPLEPIEFRLSQNYPNPFNPDTNIEFSLPKKSLVKIIIYNALGQKVKVLIEESRKAGFHQVVWNGLNEQGFAVSSGVYLYRIETKDKIATKKMVLIR